MTALMLIFYHEEALRAMQNSRHDDSRQSDTPACAMAQVESPKRFSNWPMMSRATKICGQRALAGPMKLADGDKSVLKQCNHVAVTGA